MADDWHDGDDLPPVIEAAIERMDPDEKVRAAIRVHIRRQRGVPDGFVRLDTEELVPVGEEPEE